MYMQPTAAPLPVDTFYSVYPFSGNGRVGAGVSERVADDKNPITSEGEEEEENRRARPEYSGCEVKF